MKKLIFFIIITSLMLSKYIYSQAYVEQYSGVTTGLTSVSLFQTNNNSAWICGYSGVVLKTTNFGVNWINKSGNGIPGNVDLINIFCVDTAIALTAGFSSTGTFVYRTSNGGANWQQVFSQPNGFIDGIWMKTPSIGFMYGDPVGSRWSLWKTTNGGNSWDSTGLYLPQAGSELGWPNSLCMPMGSPSPLADSNKIWFGTNNYRIYYSSNYGQNWSIQAFPLEQNIFCIAYGMDYSGTTLHAGGSNLLFKSTNYGINWTRDSVGGSGSIRGITFAWCSFYLSRYNKIYIKNYSGIWYPCFIAPAGTFNYIDNRGHGLWYDHYGVRTNGAISFICEGEGVQKISSEIPNGFSLFQNYPNPFNPTTRIKFSIPPLRGARGMIKLVIYDILGREVATLVNEQFKSGTYEVEWDGTNYPSGVYFYKLIVSDASASSGRGYTETRKMVLIK